VTRPQSSAARRSDNDRHENPFRRAHQVSVQVKRTGKVRYVFALVVVNDSASYTSGEDVQVDIELINLSKA